MQEKAVLERENSQIFQARSLCSFAYVDFLDVDVLSEACESFIVHGISSKMHGSFIACSNVGETK